MFCFYKDLSNQTTFSLPLFPCSMICAAMWRTYWVTQPPIFLLDLHACASRAWQMVFRKHFSSRVSELSCVATRYLQGKRGLRAGLRILSYIKSLTSQSNGVCNCDPCYQTRRTTKNARNRFYAQSMLLLLFFARVMHWL